MRKAIIIMVLAIISFWTGYALACEHDACGELDMRAGIVSTEDAEAICTGRVSKPDKLFDLMIWCPSKWLNEIEPGAGDEIMEAGDLDPIDMQGEWLYDGANLE